MATVDGEYKKIFGWETDSTGEEYTKFIRRLFTELIAFMKKDGNDKRCFFHISDEPHIEHIEKYRAAKNSVMDILKGYPIMDALSDFDFYKHGVIDNPIPSTDHIAHFLEVKLDMFV